MDGKPEMECGPNSGMKAMHCRKVSSPAPVEQPQLTQIQMKNFKRRSPNAAQVATEDDEDECWSEESDEEWLEWSSLRQTLIRVEKSALAKPEVTLQNDAKNGTDLSVIRNHSELLFESFYKAISGFAKSMFTHEKNLNEDLKAWGFASF